MPAMLALTTMQPIVGVDMHTSIPPLPATILPHVVVWGTGLSLAEGFPSVTASHAMSPAHPHHYIKPVAVGTGHACGRGHDAGMHLGHIAGNSLLLSIWLASSSKAEFGSSKVRIQGEHMAANVMNYLNVQLHCNDPVPMPTGISLALGSNMVYVDVTWKDILNGMTHMLVDVAIAALLNFVLGGVAKVVGRVLKGRSMTGLLSELADDARKVGQDLEDIFKRRMRDGSRRVFDWDRLTPRGFAKQFADFARSHAHNPEQYNTRIIPRALGGAASKGVPGYFLGGPMGISFSETHSPVAEASSATDDFIDSLFY